MFMSDIDMLLVSHRLTLQAVETRRMDGWRWRVGSRLLKNNSCSLWRLVCRSRLNIVFRPDQTSRNLGLCVISTEKGRAAIGRDEKVIAHFVAATTARP